MKKALTTIAILGGIAAAVAYKLKKDEEKKIMKLEQELLDEENSTENHEAETDQEACCCCEAEPEAACSCAEESCGCDVLVKKAARVKMKLHVAAVMKRHVPVKQKSVKQQILSIHI